jgi:ribosome biogenesis GTPase / thiamine phosphate phosphatase
MSDWREPMGWSAHFEAGFAEFEGQGLKPARVVFTSRKQLRVFSEFGERWVRLSGSLIHRAKDARELPAVGDWVAVRLAQNGEGLVHAVLPRRTAFIRNEAGDNVLPQVIAANVDTVFIVMGLDQDFNVRRLERYLTLTAESGAKPVLVLNKSDLLGPSGSRQLEIETAAAGVPVYSVSALQDQNLDALRYYCQKGQTIALLGSSGVGKSTLVNRLVGQNVTLTGSVKEDGKGRHTTSQRELLLLPTGGLVIDTPGLRELQMWGAAASVDKAFDDIDELSNTCRFSDCRHEAEPGCQVKAAIESGSLDLRRFENWQQLKRELVSKAAFGKLKLPITRRKDRIGK